MARKTIKEIAAEGLTEAVWRKAERNMVFRERNQLRRSGRIRAFPIPTPLIRDDNGPIKCVGGQRYSIGHETTYKGEA